MTTSLSKPSKARKGSAKYLLRVLTGSITFSIPYKWKGFKATACSDANCDKNPDDDNSTPSYIVMLVNDPINIKHIASTWTFKA